MVRGFELFRERFANFGDAFIVIGGTACDLNLEAFGGFRRTKDIDKHRNDVFRLIGALADGVTVPLPDSIRNRMAEFIDVFTAANPEWSAIRASIGTLALDPSIYIAKYREVFGV